MHGEIHGLKENLAGKVVAVEVEDVDVAEHDVGEVGGTDCFEVGALFVWNGGECQ